jgi:hypothetical protein
MPVDSTGAVVDGVSGAGDQSDHSAQSAGDALIEVFTGVPARLRGR